MTSFFVVYQLNTKRVSEYLLVIINVMRSAIWNHLFNLKNMKNTHGGVLILQITFCSFHYLYCFLRLLYTISRLT